MLNQEKLYHHLSVKAQLHGLAKGDAQKNNIEKYGQYKAEKIANQKAVDAKRGEKIIEEFKEEGCGQGFKTGKDIGATDNNYVALFTQYRHKYNLCLLTNDIGLSKEIQNLNKSESSEFDKSGNKIIINTIKIFVFTLIISTGLVAQNNALDFDGSNDYISYSSPNILSFTGTASFTIEAWVKVGDLSAASTIVSRYEGTVGAEYYVSLNSDNKVVVHREVSPWTLTSSGTVSENTWTHVATVYDGTNITIYINGISSGTIASGNVTGSYNTFYIGRTGGG